MDKTQERSKRTQNRWSGGGAKKRTTQNYTYVCVCVCIKSTCVGWYYIKECTVLFSKMIVQPQWLLKSVGKKKSDGDGRVQSVKGSG